MDPLDRAQSVEEQFREAAIRAVTARPHEAGATLCDWCGRPIPADRREANPDARTCIDCQEIKERERR